MKSLMYAERLEIQEQERKVKILFRSRSLLKNRRNLRYYTLARTECFAVLRKEVKKNQIQ